MKKLLRLIMAMVLTALLLTACGGGEEKKSTAKSVEPPKTEEKSEPEKAPEEAKTAMTAAEKELYNSAYPIMIKSLEDMDKIVEFLKQSESNPNWKEEVRVMIENLIEQSRFVATLKYTEETATIGLMFQTGGHDLCEAGRILIAFLDGETVWEEAFKAYYDMAIAYQKEIEFYGHNGFRLYVQFAEDVKSVVKNSEVYSAKGEGGNFSVELDFEVSSLNKVTEKNCLSDMLNILKMISENSDYEYIQVRISALEADMESGQRKVRYLIDCDFKPEVIKTMDFETIKWSDLPGYSEDYRNYL